MDYALMRSKISEIRREIVNGKCKYCNVNFPSKYYATYCVPDVCPYKRLIMALDEVIRIIEKIEKRTEKFDTIKRELLDFSKIAKELDISEDDTNVELRKARKETLKKLQKTLEVIF